MKTVVGRLWSSIPIRGMPNDVTFEALDSLTRAHVGKPLQQVSYVGRLSLAGADRGPNPTFEAFQPWLRRSGTYRLLLETAGGDWSVVYKNDVRVPAMSVFQEYWYYGNLQGELNAPTEYLIYSHCVNTLAKYLAKTYLCAEVVPGRHYQYLLEDLHDYRPALGTRILSVVAELPAIHKAMREWGRGVGSDRIFRNETLKDSLRGDLEDYVRKTSDKLALKVMKLWERVYDPQREWAKLTMQPLHGDLWPSNSLVQERDPHRVKIVDWESILWGAPHTDLATLLWDVKPSLEEEALTLYSRHEKHLTLKEHTRLYRCCQEEYCVFTAAGYIKAHMEHGSKRPVKLPKRIHKRLESFIV